MTIEKGRPWGEETRVPAGVTVCGSDAEVARVLAAGGLPLVTGGNLHASLGSPPTKTTGQACMRFPVDTLEVTLTKETSENVLLAVSEVVVGSWWHGTFLLASANGRWEGLDLAPRAHPNDGMLHVLEIPAAVDLRQRISARRRAALGTHVPHPRISVRSMQTLTVTRSGRSVLRVDGERLRGWESVTVRVVADGGEVLS